MCEGRLPEGYKEAMRPPCDHLLSQYTLQIQAGKYTENLKVNITDFREEILNFDLIKHPNMTVS